MSTFVKTLHNSIACFPFIKLRLSTQPFNPYYGLVYIRSSGSFSCFSVLCNICSFWP